MKRTPLKQAAILRESLEAQNFTWQGQSYTRAELDKARGNQPFDEYISMNGVELENENENFQNDPVNAETNTGSNQNNMVSNSDDALLALLTEEVGNIEPLSNILEDDAVTYPGSLNLGEKARDVLFDSGPSIREVRLSLSKVSENSEILENYPEYKVLLEKYNNFSTTYNTGEYSEDEIELLYENYTQELEKFEEDKKGREKYERIAEERGVKRDNIQDPFANKREFVKLKNLDIEIEDRAPIFVDPNVRNPYEILLQVETGLTDSESLTEEDISILKEDKNFNIELGFYENDSERDPNTLNLGYVDDESVDFVNMNFDSEELIKLGINPQDFAGYLLKNDIMQQYIEDVENNMFNPSFISNSLFGPPSNTMRLNDEGEYVDEETYLEQKALKVAKQKRLFSMLDDYMTSRDDIAKNTGFYYDYLNNKEEYEGSLTENQARLKYQKKGIEEGYIESYTDRDGKKRFIDHRSLYENPMSYIENVFNEMFKDTEADQQAMLDKIEDIDSRGSIQEALAGPVNYGGGLIQGFTAAVDETFNFVTDLLPGGDMRAQKRNLVQIEIDERNPLKSIDYFYVNGKGVKFGDDYYLKDVDGKLYNTSKGYNVDGFLDPKIASDINKKIEEEGVPMSDYSYRGGATMTGDVIGNVVFQIMGMKGAGMGRAALSAKYIERVNKARKLKGLKPLNTRVRNIKTGKFDSTKGTFGVDLSKKIPVLNITNKTAANLVDVTMFQSFYGAVSGKQKTLLEAQKAGIPFEEAKKLANEASVKMAALYALTAFIAPRIKASEALDKFLVSNATMNRAVKAFKVSGPQGFTNSFKASADKFKTNFLINANTFAREGAKEVVQENIQQAGEIYGINPGLNEAAGVDFKQVEISKQDFVNTSILSMIAGGLVPVSGSIASSFSNKSDLDQRIKDLYVLSRDMKSTSKRFRYLVDKGLMSQQDMTDLMGEIKAIGNQHGKLPAFMLSDPESFIEAARILEEIQQAKNRKEKLAKELQSIEDVNILALTDQLNNVIDFSSKKQVRQDVENVRKFSDAKVYRSDENGTVEEKMIADGVVANEADMRKFEADGFMEVDGQIIINEDKAIEKQAVSVASHELLHKILRSEIKNNPKIAEVINQFRDILKAKGLLKDIEQKIKDGNYDVTFNEDGTVEGADIDEYMNFFSDAIIKNQILRSDLSDGFLMDIGRKIINFIRTIGGLRDVKFKTGQDVFEFIKNYSLNIEKGKLTSQAKAKLKSSEGVTVEKEKLSVSALDAINKLVPETVNTKEEYFDRKIFNPVYEATLENGVINNYIKSKSSTPEIAAKALESVQDRLINYNPNAKRKTKSGEPITFGEFIFSNVNFGKLDAKKALAIEGNRRDESLDSDKAKQVAADETVQAKKDRKKFTTLTESKVLPADQANVVKSKLNKIVRVLKSKVNNVVSINKTVSPLISEIKKEAGKQADIEFKKRLGVKKGGQLKRNFLRFKKPILENMTTSWLSQAMPFAVQKKVNGSFTSDWQGKKIDRETVSTEQAGRTSGAQLIRRVPNIANNITDEQFLSYMFNEKGDVIRGKKESLSKAMAEEYTLDLFNEELQNPESDISKSFEKNQKALGVVLFDNYINEISRQSERGNVKFSFNPSKKFSQASSKLFSLAQKTGIENVVDEDGNILVNPDDYSNFKGIGYLVRKPFDEGLVVDDASAGFIRKIQDSDQIPESVKENNKNATTAKTSSKEILDAFNKDMGVILSDPRIGKDITDIIGYDSFGYISRLLDAASKKEDVAATVLAKIEDPKAKKIYIPGVTGNYYDALQKNKLKQKDESKKLPKELDLNKVSPMNSKIGVMGKVGRILNNDKLSREEKVEAYKKLIPEISSANVHNKILANHIANTVIDLFNKNKISAKSFITFFQLQTNATKGLRSLTSLDYITFTEQSPGLLKGEHLADSATSMFEIAELGFSKIPKAERISKVEQIFEYHTQWLDSKSVLDFVDVFGKNNPSKDLRLKFLPQEYLNNILTFDLKPAITLIDQKEQAIKNYNGSKFSFSNYNKAIVNTKALFNATKYSYSQNPKGISVWDFDDTLAQTKSNVLYTMPDGAKGKIDATQFALKSAELEAQGAKFDFSEFSKVMKGKKGPMFEKAIARNKKFGNSNVFILTARPQAAAPAIHKFLKGIGLDIPIENITGLEDGTAKAKADWMITKIAEGYNDFYFADDAIKNVKAVKQIYDNFDVKGKVQQARVKYSETLDEDFNKMIERQKGVESFKEFSKVVAKRRGARKGRYKFFLPPSAEDFRGLTQYVFSGKGKQGEADQKFFEDALMTPYFKGVASIESARQAMKRDILGLKQNHKNTTKILTKLIPDGDYTYNSAVRVYLWSKAGFEIPGITKRDQQKLTELVANNPELKGFAEAVLLITKKETWPEPSNNWDSQSILTDLNSLTEKINRKEYLQEFNQNVDIIFSEKNLNKIQALYGDRLRSAIEDSIRRMKSGSNRESGGSQINNSWLNWINNSVGTIMFFNRRSALLQLISTTNFINWSDNNPLKAAIAFANQPQYWKDFAMIWNSDKLKQRRGGLKSDVQEQEIANAAKNSKDKANAVISYLLKIGFTPTQLADSFAIASGGATMFRNRVNTYLKQGMSKVEAEKKAFNDFSKISDEAQQSGDPALVSQQQSSTAGRLILAFQNTPMQYTRLMKKAGQDLINGRGDAKTNLSKILYYGFIQNLIFNALSQAYFSLLPGFDDEPEDDKEAEKRAKNNDAKSGKILNGMIDSVLRGSGIYGAILSTVKNTFNVYRKQDEKGYTGDQAYTIIEAANISPPIGSKLRKIYSAIQTRKFNKEVMGVHPWDIIIDGKYNPSPTYEIIGSLTSAIGNLPLDRLLIEAKGVAEVFDSRNTMMQRVALALGWRTWGVGAKNEEFDLLKIEVRERKKEDKKIQKQIQKELEYQNLTPEERLELELEAAIKRSESAKKGAATRKRNKRIKDSILTQDLIKLLQQ